MISILGLLCLNRLFAAAKFQLTFHPDFESVNVTFANLLLDKHSRSSRCDAVRRNYGKLWTREPVHLELGSLGFDNTRALLIDHVNKLIGASRPDHEVIIRPIDGPSDDVGGRIQISIRDGPRCLSLKTKWQANCGTFDGHDAVLLLDQSKGAPRSLAAYGDLELILKEGSAFALVLDTAESKNVFTTL